MIAAPAFLFMIMLIVQAGLYFHALSIAGAAAQEGARDAAVQGASLLDGEATAGNMVADLAPELLDEVAVDGRMVDGGESVRVTVSGEVSTVFVVPGFDIDLSVTESAETPVERFRPAGEAPPSDDT